MGAYIARRLIHLVIVILLVSIIVFIMVRTLPGDPILIYLSQQDLNQLTPERIEELRHEVGLDKPLVIQYFHWLGDTFTGDLGTSIIHHGKVADDIKRRLPITLELGILATILSIIIGIPVGIIAAVKRGTGLDNSLTSIGNLGICIPSFWLGILLIYLVGFKLDLLPISGFTSPSVDFSLHVRQVILPVICLAVPAMAADIRLMRSSMLEVMRQDYIRTAWSKGLQSRAVIVRHAMKNSLLPVITMKGMSLAGIVGGSVIIEQVFSIPGMGRLAVEALFSQDYSVIQATLLIIGSATLLINLLVDISYGWLDPRIRYG